MEVVKFLKEYARMCDAIFNSDERCSKCKLYSSERRNCNFDRLTKEDPNKIVEIVEEWGKENPIKTYAQDFFEKYPDAPVNSWGEPTIKWCDIYSDGDCHKTYAIVYRKCSDCWLTPLGEKP